MDETTGKLVQGLIVIIGSLVLLINGIKVNKKIENSKEECDPSLSLQVGAGACALCMLCWAIPCFLWVLIHEVLNWI